MKILSILLFFISTPQISKALDCFDNAIPAILLPRNEAQLKKLTGAINNNRSIDFELDAKFFLGNTPADTKKNVEAFIKTFNLQIDNYSDNNAIMNISLWKKGYIYEKGKLFFKSAEEKAILNIEKLPFILGVFPTRIIEGWGGLSIALKKDYYLYPKNPEMILLRKLLAGFEEREKQPAALIPILVSIKKTTSGQVLNVESSISIAKELAKMKNEKIIKVESKEWFETVTIKM